MNYTLKNEEISVTFDSLGGTLASIKDKQGIEYLWQGDKTFWSGQSPVLFPICGSLRNDQALTKDGEILSMPRHGIVRKLEFVCEQVERDTINFSIETNHSLYKSYPYKFKLSTCYKLINNEIKVTYIIENKDQQTIPFFIGGHPGFNCPLTKEETYEDYFLEFEKEENCSIPTPITETGLIEINKRTSLLINQKKLSISHQLFKKDAIILDQLKSRKVTMKSKKTHYSIEVEFNDFPYLILWSTANDGPFIAIEPWVGLSTCEDESDLFEEKRSVQYVKVNEKSKYTFTIKINK